MCNVCCKEFKGWCRSFTWTEIALTIVQAVLLIIFITFLTFLIMHLIACLSMENFNNVEITKSKPTENIETTVKIISIPKSTYTTVITTLDPGIECTWKPSEKTKSVTNYYEANQVTTPIITSNYEAASKVKEVNVNELLATNHNDDEADVLVNGKIADNITKGYVLALVKLKLPQDVTFGCILTIISEYCTLTAASCIESIEEVDAVDSFVMMEGYGEKIMGKLHTVSDVLIHPEYQGNNRKYDVAMLKSEDSLLKIGQQVVKLSTMLDALMITIGEQFTLLGYGRFRRVEHDKSRELRVVSVLTLPSAQCAGAWSPRRLSHGDVLLASSCGMSPLCAGAPEGGHAGSAAPCGYCAGAPLLRDSQLVGIMAAGPCGDSCEPALYVNLASIDDWLHSVLTVE